MRWKGIIFLIAIVVVCVILSSLMTSRIVENELEHLGTSIIGALVEIEDHRAILALMADLEDNSVMIQHWAEESLERLDLKMVDLNPE